MKRRRSGRQPTCDLPQIGPRAGLCTRLLNEISQAKLTLLHPAKRRAYDGSFAVGRGAGDRPAAALPARGPAFDLEDIQEDIGPSGGLVAPRSLDIAKPGRSGLNVAWLAAGSGILILTLVLVVVGVLLAMRSPPARPVPLAAVKKEDNKEPKGKVAEAVDPKQEKPAEVNPPASLRLPCNRKPGRDPGQGVQDVPGTPKAQEVPDTRESHPLVIAGARRKQSGRRRRVAAHL